MMEQLETHSSLGVWENGAIANIEREGRRRSGYGGEKKGSVPFCRRRHAVWFHWAILEVSAHSWNSLVK